VIRRLAAVALLVVLALAAVGCGDDSASDTTADPSSTGATDADAADSVITLDVVDDALVGGVRREAVSQGDTVLLIVTGDSSDQVHVHGYDRYVELVDGDGELTFTALIPGIFEVELEAAGRLLIQLEVS